MLPRRSIAALVASPIEQDLGKPTAAYNLHHMISIVGDENILLTPPILFSLEQALEFIEEDELVEVTPTSVRVRKRHLKEHERKRAGRVA